MAKTIGALLSFKAYGSIGNVLTYQGRTGYRHCHIKARPRNPKSAAQTADRERFASIVRAWALLTDEEKAGYEELGRAHNNIPGFNMYISLRKKPSAGSTKFGAFKYGAQQFGY
jgi:hypothetical protein